MPDPTGNQGKGTLRAAVFARYQDARNFYWAGLGWSTATTESLFIRKRTANAWTFLTMMNTTTSTAGAWHTVKLQVVGSTLTMFLDGVPMLTTTDTSFTAGRIAVGSFNMPVEFDDVRVTAP